MSYGNGRIPLDRLVHLGGEHYLPPGTAARWKWLQRVAHEKYGVWLIITVGWNAYRPLDVQVTYKRLYGNMAAEPGKSSHGGTFGGRIVFAVDVNNWAALGWDRFVALCRLAGFTVDFVSPREQWHIGDFNDGWAVPAGSETTPTIKPETTRKRRRETMIHAAWRDTNGTIGVQCRPNGRITLIGDPIEWAGISAGSGASFYQVGNDHLQGLIRRFGTIPWPNYDDGTTTQHVQVVAPLDGGPSRYLAFGDDLWPISGTDALAKVMEQGVAVVMLPADVIKARLKS
ncbi:hypothetical protein MicroSTF_13990 [Microbacterium sp. STF-2]|uniref:hypothetical protein n=1 Tax=Microbacterium sp. STF-2 TaxID=3031132 RepID=UPI002B00225A|nr:hypothetical protein [Microbacterium sp. STF-2]MEA1264149.1 hypothetical protein [Microbacterium sp. STF-2]